MEVCRSVLHVDADGRAEEVKTEKHYVYVAPHGLAEEDVKEFARVRLGPYPSEVLVIDEARRIRSVYPTDEYKFVYVKEVYG